MKSFAADKIFAHRERIMEWLKTGTPRPVTFELDITNACNHRCPSCFGFHPALDASRMGFADIKNILAQIAELGAKAVTFTGGGEPLAHPQALPALAHARSLGLDVALITNGSALTPEAAEVILTNCVWTRISLDAASPEVFQKMHGLNGNAYHKVLANIRELCAQKAKSSSRCTIGIGFLTSRQSRADTYGFSRIGRELGVDYAQYRPLLRRHGEPDIDYLEGKEIADMTRGRCDFSNERYHVLCSEHKYRQISAGTIARSYAACYGQHFATVIGADMKVYVCCHMRGLAKYCLGDLRRETLRGIWYSQRRQETAQSIDFKDCPPLCRCDSFNRILWDIKTGSLPEASWPPDAHWEHENFI